MGIQYLNRFLLDNCNKNSIKKVHLKTLRKKTIVVDTSIYLYKFVAENALLEHMYLLISIFRHYEIIPIFVFDGKPPVEKRELLYQRRLQKREAETKYLELKEELEKQISDGIENAEIQKELDSLKKQFTTITFDHIQIAKDLMDAYGVTYCCAEGEADLLCVHLVSTGKAWGCMSDDMDMFVYGCPRVFRQLSLLNHSIVCYNTESILHDLDMDLKIFQEIAVLSGTDYNSGNGNTSLHETMKHYTEYKRYMKKYNEDNLTFYEWLNQNTDYIKDYNSLIQTIQLFDLSSYVYEKINDICFTYKTICMDVLKPLMETDGFVFL